MTEQTRLPAAGVRAVCLEVALAWALGWLCGLPWAGRKYALMVDGWRLPPWLAAALLAVVLVGVLAFVGYFRFEPRQFAQNLRAIAGACLVFDFPCAALLQWIPAGAFDLWPHLLQWACQVVVFLCLRRVGDRWLKRPVFLRRRHVMVGQSRDGQHFLRQLTASAVGQVCYVPAGGARLEEEIARADYVYLCDDLPQGEKAWLLSVCIRQDKMAALVPRLYEISLQNAEMTQVGDVMVCRVGGFRLRALQRAVKRMGDILLSLAGLVFFSPVMLWACVAIKREDGGRVIYRQPRVGRDGAVFQMYKFRSMVADAEAQTGAVLSPDGDARVTRVGRVMRARRIDEMPQFVNVLAGKMSLVGPRPERPEFVQEFARENPEYNYRLMVKPGMTGLAQVMGNYATTPRNKLKFDLAYIRNYSFMQDLKLLLRTAGMLFPQKAEDAGENPAADDG